MPVSALALEHGLKITPRPEKIYIEKNALGQAVNCDFILENITDRNWRIRQIDISVFDFAGQLASRRFVNESGSIQTIPNRELSGKTSTLILNPFFLFDHSLELGSLHFRFTFASASLDDQDAETSVTVETTIAPVLYATQTPLHLPVKNRALIWDGHDFYSHHRRFNYLHPMLQHFGFQTNFQRYGYDFVPVDANGNMFRGDYENNADWLGFDTPVCATANGRVADCFDGMPDNRRFDEMEIATREMVVFGNYVILDHENGEHSCLAHLKQGSISVKLGEAVQQGQIIGHIGASGSSLFPHLHYELRNGLGAKQTEGLPSYFHQFRRVLGSTHLNVEVGPIDTGDIVEPL